MSSVLQQERLTLLNVLRRTTSMQSMIQFMRWLVTRLDTEELLRDFLTDISVNYKIDKYHLKMQRKNQFVKMSFYELVLFWSISASLKLSQSNSVSAFGFSYESKHIRICSFVHFSTARSDGRLFLSKNLISVVSIFFSNSPPSYLHRTKIFTTP